MSLKCICGCDWAIHDFLGRCNGCECKKNQMVASAALGEVMIDPQTVERARTEAEAKWREITAKLNAQIQELTEQRDARQRERDEAVAAKDGAYRERDMCVAMAARLAVDHGLRAGLGQHDPNDKDWDADWRTIVYIELPSGQCSWHIHDSERQWFSLSDYSGPWDGHTTPEKYERVLAYARRAR